MWLCTKYGFFSIVEKNPGEYHIRARVRGDLENLQELFARNRSVISGIPHIERWPEADYRFRIITDLAHVRELFELLGESITYPDFKREIAARPDQREKLFAYHGIWADLHALQPPRNIGIPEPENPGIPM